MMSLRYQTLFPEAPYISCICSAVSLRINGEKTNPCTLFFILPSSPSFSTPRFGFNPYSSDWFAKQVVDILPTRKKIVENFHEVYFTKRVCWRFENQPPPQFTWSNFSHWVYLFTLGRSPGPERVTSRYGRAAIPLYRIVTFSVSQTFSMAPLWICRSWH